MKALLLAAAIGTATAHAAPDNFKPVPASKFKPEMLVEVAFPGWYWCTTPTEYTEFTLHTVRGEITKAAAMLDGKRCSEMPNDQFRILSIKRVKKNALLELGPVDRSRSNGFWTLHEGMKPVR